MKVGVLATMIFGALIGFPIASFAGLAPDADGDGIPDVLDKCTIDSRNATAPGRAITTGRLRQRLRCRLQPELHRERDRLRHVLRAGVQGLTTRLRGRRAWTWTAAAA